MEENREKLHEMIDSMNSGMLEYFETFIRLFLQKWATNIQCVRHCGHILPLRNRFCLEQMINFCRRQNNEL